MSGHAEVAATKLPWRCRWFGHSWSSTKWSGDSFSATDRKGRYTQHGVQTCWRCGTKKRVELFLRDLYWDSIRRDNEDKRLEEVIRRATR